ncbi:uncharacterized protein CXorf66 homolog [Heterocephalus glaber]|uniref:Uncharacterized protein CXorf66 homolog n=1 Tax=Heterocephalus glaber TaxID=10181 RepID=A0AAX6RLK3_HETGA|nr:uncharacterized protein CXorf66 homolog [Heterocephalus glaber]
MTLFICVLLLSIWATNCLNISTSNGSSTARVRPLNSTKEEKVENCRKPLLKVLHGLMMTAFFAIHFCLIHYNCMIKPIEQKPVKKEGVEAKLCWPAILPLSKSKTKDLCRPEKQTLLPNVDDLSRPANPEMSPIPPNAEKLVRQSSSKKSSKPSLIDLLKSFYLEELHRIYLQKTHKKTHKLAAQVSSPSSAKPAKVPSQASLQSLGRPAESPYPENQILVNNISEEKDDDIQVAGYLPVSNEMMSFARSFHKVDSQDHEYFAIVSDNYKVDDSDEDSDTEITIICNIMSNDLLPKGTPNN